MTVAALYVETGGVYYGLPDVDPWDWKRDARLYDGPWPVVAHPPCNRWSKMATANPAIAHLHGKDGGTFAAALEAVRTFGGVLEHPAYSRAWAHFELPTPATFGWAQSLTDPGYTTEVDQLSYGHMCHKPTWLYFVGREPPPPLRWRIEGEPRQDVRNASKLQRIRSPLAFRDELLDLARAAALPREAQPCLES